MAVSAVTVTALPLHHLVSEGLYELGSWERVVLALDLRSGSIVKD